MLNDHTLEGESLRRFLPLELASPRAATFVLSWTAVHPIAPSSPLYGLSHEDLVRREAGIIVSLTGIDETFASQIHARYDYSAAEIVF